MILVKFITKIALVLGFSLALRRGIFQEYFISDIAVDRVGVTVILRYGDTNILESE